MGCGAALTLDYSGTVTSAKISLGAVAATVLVVEGAANAIIGTKLEPEAMSALDAACQAACNPIDDKRGTVEYRTKVAGVLGKRVVKIAADRAGNKV